MHINSSIKRSNLNPVILKHLFKSFVFSPFSNRLFILYTNELIDYFHAIKYLSDNRINDIEAIIHKRCFVDHKQLLFNDAYDNDSTLYDLQYNIFMQYLNIILSLYNSFLCLNIFFYECFLML